jgi:hypothetical protein
MSRTFRFPVWTPRSFPDASQRWLVNEPEALRCVTQAAGVPASECFQFRRRRELHRTVTFPSFTLRAGDLFFSVPWRAARQELPIDLIWRWKTNRHRPR